MLEILEEETRAILYAAVPELAPPSLPKKLGFWEGLMKSMKWWNRGIESGHEDNEDKEGYLEFKKFMRAGIALSISFGTIFGINLSILLDQPLHNLVGTALLSNIITLALFFAIMWYRITHTRKISTVITALCAGTGFLVSGWRGALLMTAYPLALLVGQSGYWMWRSRKEYAQALKHSLPVMTPMEIRTKVASHMKNVVRAAKEKLLGSDSKIEKLGAEIRKELEAARTDFKKTSKLLSDDWNNVELQELKITFQRQIHALENVLKVHEEKQQYLLDHLRTFEASMSGLNTVLEIEALRHSAARREGLLPAITDASEQTYLEIIDPHVRVYLPLARAIEDLRVDMATALEGPGSLTRLYAAAEHAGEEHAKLDRKKGEILSIAREA
jgi:hypothetical protein